MSVTYTRALWNVQIQTVGVTVGPVVPPGELWVVRDVTMWLLGTTSTPPFGDVLLEEAHTGTVLWGVGYLEASPGRVFHSELRQAVAAGNQLQCRAGSAGWSVAVTGFVFSAP